MFKTTCPVSCAAQNVGIGATKGLLLMRRPMSSFTLSSALSFGFDLMISNGPSIAAECRHEGEARSAIRVAHSERP